MHKHVLLLALLAALLGTLIACGAPATTAPAPANTTAPSGNVNPPNKPPAAAPVRGGTLRVGLEDEPTTMDPHMSTAAVDRQVYQSIFNSLVRLDQDLTFKPELADKWEFTDPKTLVLTLHKGVKFHDGTDFNAKAAKANFDRIMNPDTKSPRASEIATVKEVVVVNDFTLQLNLTQPDAALLAQLTDRAGMMISPAAIDKFGKDLARNPVGTGPFQFVEWIRDDHLSTKKFADYWEKGDDGQALPYLDAVTYKAVTDQTVRLNSLKTNTLDIIQSLAAKDIPAMRQQKDFVLSEVPGLGYDGLSLNLKKPPFDKLEVRQAVAMSVDRDALAKSLFFDTVKASEGPLPTSSWAFDQSINNIFKHDPVGARALLQKAGLTPPVKFSCQVSNTPQAIQIAQATKEQLAEGGLDMELELLEFGTALAKYNNKEHICFQIGWSGRPDPDGNIFSFLVTNGGLNRDQYSNPKVDELLNKARATYDQSERKKLYTEALQTAVSEVAIVYLDTGNNYKAYTPKLNGFVHVPDGMMRLKRVWLVKGTQ